MPFNAAYKFKFSRLKLLKFSRSSLSSLSLNLNLNFSAYFSLEFQLDSLKNLALYWGCPAAAQAPAQALPSATAQRRPGSPGLLSLTMTMLTMAREMADNG